MTFRFSLGGVFSCSDTIVPLLSRLYSLFQIDPENSIALVKEGNSPNRTVARCLPTTALGVAIQTAKMEDKGCKACRVQTDVLFSRETVRWTDIYIYT